MELPEAQNLVARSEQAVPDLIQKKELEAYKFCLFEGHKHLKDSNLRLAKQYFDKILRGKEILYKIKPQLLADAYTYKGIVLTKELWQRNSLSRPLLFAPIMP